jgi:chromosome segregation ATPase
LEARIKELQEQVNRYATQCAEQKSLIENLQRENEQLQAKVKQVLAKAKKNKQTEERKDSMIQKLESQIVSLQQLNQSSVCFTSLQVSFFFLSLFLFASIYRKDLC